MEIAASVAAHVRCNYYLFIYPFIRPPTHLSTRSLWIIHSYLRIRLRRPNAAKVPSLAPEFGRILGRPFIQSRVVVNVEPEFVSHMVEKSEQGG